MYRLIALLIGYMIGSFQTGYLVGKLYGIDIREHGSKSAGMTNVNRTLGKKPALVVFVADVFKAALAFVVVPIIIMDSSWSFPLWAHTFSDDFDYCGVLPGLYAGAGAIIGHNFPFYLKFKGGKGIASTIGLILMMDWRVALIAYAVGFITAYLTKCISPGSLGFTLVIPILLALFGYTPEVIIAAAFLSALAWYLHRDNIARLLAGTESKFVIGK